MKPFVQWLKRRLLLGNDLFLEELQDDVVDLRQRHNVAIIVLHEQLNAGLGLGVHEAKSLGKLTLASKMQLIFFSLGKGVQAIAHPPQKTAAIFEPTCLSVCKDL